MAKKKRGDKDTSKDKAQEASVQKAADGFSAVSLPPGTMESLNISPSVVSGISPYGISGIIPSTSPYYIPTLDPSVLMVSPEEVFKVSVGQDQLENEITELRKENRRLGREIAERTVAETKIEEEILRLKENVEELNKKQRLHYLLDRVKESARIKLLEPESEEFREIFEKQESCNAFVISVDIRRSTELMLRAREPQLYADFIATLCAELTTIILNNYGVFDKFTGDGILAFFPDFYSGEDAAYLAIRAADECHSCFSRLYKQKRSSFNAVLMDVGLGIGIDYGLSHLIKLQDGLTVIGNPVVYACRMSGAKAGLTLLNQPAYELISEHFSKYVSLQESEIDIKHEGNMLAYIATLSKKVYEPKLPDWEKPLTFPES